jgi:hypothetical protein
LAARGIVRHPGFSAVILGTLALGIGANVAIFSVVNGVLLRPLPFRDAARVVSLTQAPPYSSVSEPEFRVYRDGLKGLNGLAAYASGIGILLRSGESQQVRAARVSDGFFSVLGTAPVAGRTFAPEVVISGGSAQARVALCWTRRRASSLAPNHCAFRPTVALYAYYI